MRNSIVPRVTPTREVPPGVEGTSGPGTTTQTDKLGKLRCGARAIAELLINYLEKTTWEQSLERHDEPEDGAEVGG